MITIQTILKKNFIQFNSSIGEYINVVHVIPQLRRGR